jgi:hypothetical protein
MNVTRVVFERGIEIRLDAGDWPVSSGGPSTPPFSSIEEATASLRPTRPVLMTRSDQEVASQTHLLSPNSGTPIVITIFAFDDRPAVSESAFFDLHRLAYLLAAVVYHCHAIAEHYARIGTAFSRMTRIPGYASSGGPAHFSFHPEPYIEFEAFIGAARRSLDATRYLLWKRFAAGRGSTPRSLEALLATSIALPPNLRAQLELIWHQHGLPLTSYRDCIHHYVPIDRGMASAEMNRLPSGIWTTNILIPDNPEARSHRAFTFDLRRDALSYSWELADTILSVAGEVVDAAVGPTAAA